MSPLDLQPLLHPRSVAVIGASADPAKAGNVLVRNILDGGFDGRVVPVNPRGGEICGLTAVTAIDATEPVDLALVVVRRELVLDAARACAAHGVRALAVMSAGFAEADEWGRDQQAQLSALVAEHGIAAIGPNAIGLVTGGGALRGTFVRFDSWRDGPVAIGAQSGVFAGAIAQQEMRRSVQGLGIRHSVSLGNKSGITEVDLLAAFAEDPHVTTIGLYLESLADAPAFFELAARVKREKPLVVLKSGRTPAGGRASASHTGSLMMDDAVFEQLARQHGIVRALDEEELVTLLSAFAKAPVPAGPGTGIVTLSGALGVIAADLATDRGLDVVDYAAPTLERIAAVLPEWQGTGNPADLWPGVERDPRGAIVGGLDAALSDPAVDQVLGLLLADPAADFPELRDDLAALLAAHPGKPLHLVLVGTLAAEWAAALEGLDLPIHPSARLATTAMAAMTHYGDVRERVPSAYADA